MTGKVMKKTNIYPQRLRCHPPDGEEAPALRPVVLLLVDVLGHAKVSHLHHIGGAHHAVPGRQVSA